MSFLLKLLYYTVKGFPICGHVLWQVILHIEKERLSFLFSKVYAILFVIAKCEALCLLKITKDWNPKYSKLNITRAISRPRDTWRAEIAPKSIFYTDHWTIQELKFPNIAPITKIFSSMQTLDFILYEESKWIYKTT